MFFHSSFLYPNDSGKSRCESLLILPKPEEIVCQVGFCKGFWIFPSRPTLGLSASEKYLRLWTPIVTQIKWMFLTLGSKFVVVVCRSVKFFQVNEYYIHEIIYINRSLLRSHSETIGKNIMRTLLDESSSKQWGFLVRKHCWNFSFNLFFLEVDFWQSQ